MNKPNTFSTKYSKSYATMESAQKAMDILESKLEQDFRWIPTPAEDKPERIIPVIILDRELSTSMAAIVHFGHPVIG